MKRSGLGLGLDVLLPQNDELFQTVVREIAIDDIDPNTAQPRKDFDKEALEQLAESIRSAGVLSPILVVQDGMRYRIVAGERRYRASRLAGLSTVPCIVRDLTNEQQMEAALIENLQRQDLNPIEEASAIRSLMDECGYTQEQAAQKLGKSRPAIANTLRLLTLPKPAAPAVKKSAAPRPLTPELHTLQDTMRQALGLKTVLTGNEKKGKITLSYNSSEELEHLYEVVGRLTE